jgi:hypothetical protein
MANMKLGKKPARRGAVKLKLAHYLDKLKLPIPPKVFGHQSAVSIPWQMLGNDKYGDCVFAGAAHETMLWSRMGEATDCGFNDSSVLADYSAVTGFNPDDPNTDQGTDMQIAASYRRKTGVADTSGQRHRVLAYLAIKPGDTLALAQAAYLFGAVGVGIKFPRKAMDQFNAGKPWAVVAGKNPIDGGHYIPCVGRNAKGNFLVVTWGKLQEMTPGFYKKYCDEAVAYISDEVLTASKTPEGLDIQQLQDDLAALPK